MEEKDNKTKKQHSMSVIRRLLEHALAECINNPDSNKIQVILYNATRYIERNSIYNDSNKKAIYLYDTFEYLCRYSNDGQFLSVLPINTMISGIENQYVFYNILSVAVPYHAYVRHDKKVCNDPFWIIHNREILSCMLLYDKAYYYIIFKTRDIYHDISLYDVGKLDKKLFDSIDTIDYIINGFMDNGPS